MGYEAYEPKPFTVWHNGEKIATGDIDQIEPMNDNAEWRKRIDRIRHWRERERKCEN